MKTGAINHFSNRSLRADETKYLNGSFIQNNIQQASCIRSRQIGGEGPSGNQRKSIRINVFIVHSKNAASLFSERISDSKTRRASDFATGNGSRGGYRLNGRMCFQVVDK